ncbi:MAG: dephospho-CoA kinase [Acidobacteria bacterium]|nr:dephospho-CoA kinase [Acidobacteriota bacterium]MCA1649488.1 dephospho-CoA kinase [Acidobacteriota bacterium]
MLSAALTGGIATGKSYCLARFRELGVPAIDADALAREAVGSGTPGLAAVAARFGAAIIRPDGTLDRPALARIVFADRTARADLEAIVHPEVYRRIREWLANLPAGTRLALADIPLLFETGHNHDFERVIVCVCEPAEQMRRLQTRDGLSESDAAARISAQWPIDDKAARGDYVIHTDGSYADTDAQVRQVYEALRAES